MSLVGRNRVRPALERGEDDDADEGDDAAGASGDDQARQVVQGLRSGPEPGGLGGVAAAGA